MLGGMALVMVRALAYRAWQDRRQNTDYDVDAVDAGEFREWFGNILAQAQSEGAQLDVEGVCLTAWRYSNHRWGELDDAGFGEWWAEHGVIT